MRFLRQSTASQEILLGPFVAAADGSAQTGLTIANTDIKLLKGGSTSETNKNSGGGTHIAGGRYSAVLDATDTDTVGILEVSVNPSSGIPWNKSYYVLEEAIYDMLFASSALGYIANAPVNVAQISGDGTAADNLETAYDDTAGAVPWAGIVDQGTAQAATGTTLQLRAAAGFANDELIGATIQITGGSTGVGQSRVITDYVASTDTATVEAWTTTPTGTITYKIYGTAPSTGGGGLDAAGVRAAIGMSSANLDTQLAGLDGKLDTIDTVVDAVKAKTDNLPSDPADQSLIIAATDALAALIGDVPTNSELTTALAAADDAVLAQVALVKAKTDNLPSDPADASVVAGLIAAVEAKVDTVDTVVDAVKAKTDSLTFTTAGMVDSAIKRVGDTTLAAAGTGGQGYGAA